MNNKSMLNKVDSKEVLTCLLLIIVGYMTAQLFMRQINGFNVGGQTCKCGDCVDDKKNIRTYYSKCSELGTKNNDCQYGYSTDGGSANKGGKFKCTIPAEDNGLCSMSGGKPNITGTCPECKDMSGKIRMSRKQCNGLSKKDCARMWGLDSGGTAKQCTWDISQSKCDLSGGKAMTCITPGPTPGPTPKTSYNCNASKCVSVSGTSGTYTDLSDCNSKCGSGSGTKPSYSCNASTSKCAIDTNGSYTNASSCNADCSSWSTAYHIIAVIIWILSFICFVVGIIIAKMSFAVIGTICSVLGIIVYNGQWISDYNSSPEKSE